MLEKNRKVLELHWRGWSKIYIYIYLLLTQYSKANSTGIWTLFNPLYCVLQNVIAQRNRPTLLILQTTSTMPIMAEASKHIPCTLQKGEDKESRNSSETRNNSNSSRASGLRWGWARQEAWLQGNPSVSSSNLPGSTCLRPKNSDKQQLVCHDSSMPIQVLETNRVHQRCSETILHLNSNNNIWSHHCCSPSGHK